ncbi:MAG: hypothetical protein ACI9FJ_003289 [Alteromonadaceae bacterium]|jgi:uncharacterized protein (TIGR03503 family)
MATITVVKAIPKIVAKWLVLFSFGLTLGTDAMAAEEDVKRSDGVEVIANNQLPLLDNRFRIDSEVKEITLLFFRNRGTPPVILVKPDGSKMYASMALTGQAQWFDETTYDLIKIKDPMPGPWQAIGQLSRGSKVLIITDFELNVDDLPPILIQGETIKLTGYVTNNGEPIKARNFKDVITLYVDFISTNNKKYRNFGADLQEVSNFADDGKGFDERPKDGVFTGEFNLSFASGEWIPKYYIRTPLMQRELEHDPVLIHPNPVNLSIQTTEVADEFHKLLIDIKGDFVKKGSLIFQGKVFYPNQEVQSFSITENEGDLLTFNVINYDFGLYRITLSAFGETTNGREFMLDIPDFTFAIDPPLIEDTGAPADQLDVNGNIIVQKVIESVELPPEPVDYTNTIIMVILVNVLLALLAFILYRVLVQGKSLKPKLPGLPKLAFLRRGKDKVGDERDDERDDENVKDKKSSDDDDILDLSLPDS